MAKRGREQEKARGNDGRSAERNASFERAEETGDLHAAPNPATLAIDCTGARKGQSKAHQRPVMATKARLR